MGSGIESKQGPKLVQEMHNFSTSMSAKASIRPRANIPSRSRDREGAGAAPSRSRLGEVIFARILSGPRCSIASPAAEEAYWREPDASSVGPGGKQRLAPVAR